MVRLQSPPTPRLDPPCQALKAATCTGSLEGRSSAEERPDQESRESHTSKALPAQEEGTWIEEEEEGDPGVAGPGFTSRP